MIKKWSKKNN